jgi:hypothetical protein
MGVVCNKSGSTILIFDASGNLIKVTNTGTVETPIFTYLIVSTYTIPTEVGILGVSYYWKCMSSDSHCDNILLCVPLNNGISNLYLLQSSNNYSFPTTPIYTYNNINHSGIFFQSTISPDGKFMAYIDFSNNFIYSTDSFKTTNQYNLSSSPYILQLPNELSTTQVFWYFDNSTTTQPISSSFSITSETDIICMYVDNKSQYVCYNSASFNDAYSFILNLDNTYLTGSDLVSETLTGIQNQSSFLNPTNNSNGNYLIFAFTNNDVNVYTSTNNTDGIVLTQESYFNGLELISISFVYTNNCDTDNQPVALVSSGFNLYYGYSEDIN